MRKLGCHLLPHSLVSWTAIKMQCTGSKKTNPLQNETLPPVSHSSLPVIILQHPVQSFNVGLHHGPLGLWLQAVHSQLLPIVAVLQTEAE